jgi:hypothetical protein
MRQEVISFGDTFFLLGIGSDLRCWLRATSWPVCKHDAANSKKPNSQLPYGIFSASLVEHKATD